MKAARAFLTLLERAEGRGWSGVDPYDGLTSGVGRLSAPLGGLPRFAVSQAILRFPQFRVLARPSARVNAKALALFLGSVHRAGSLLGNDRARAVGDQLLAEIASRCLSCGAGLGWGYPFPWQSRYFWAPANTPNAVVTATVGWHLLDWAESTGDERATRMGCAAARFLATELHVSRAGDGEALSYTSADRTRVVNISALGARLLLRASQVEAAPSLGIVAGWLTRFVLSAQREDGSWPYSADAHGDWEDSFHTGYVLESLVQLAELGMEIRPALIARGFEAYERFFGAEGEARLHSMNQSVLDAHAAAQGIITYTALARSTLLPEVLRDTARTNALRIARWALDALWMPERGCFAYRIRGGRRDERDFLRWVQAWMALAMATVARLHRTDVEGAELDAAEVVATA